MLLKWNDEEIERFLLHQLQTDGLESTKVDFKREIMAQGNRDRKAEHRAELIRDIITIANSYDEEHLDDYGFIVFGADVSNRIITGVESTTTNSDELQAFIDRELHEFVSPVIKTHVKIFTTDDEKKWGVIIIPPSPYKPHMVAKELSCQNPSKTLSVGRWWVRTNTTRTPGLPEHLAVINQRQFEGMLSSVKESIVALKHRVKELEDSRLEVPQATNNQTGDDAVYTTVREDSTLGDRISRALSKPEDVMAIEMVSQAEELREYLLSESIPWDPQFTGQEDANQILAAVEEASRPFLQTIVAVAIHDNAGKYTDALIRALRKVAIVPEAPIGKRYNDVGIGLRYYVVSMILSVAAACCFASGNFSLLRRILETPLRHKRLRKNTPIIDVLFLVRRLGDFLNQDLKRSKCDAVGERIKQLYINNFEEDVLDSDELEAFFFGEFLLSLKAIDDQLQKGAQPETCRPCSGSFLYSSDATYIIKESLTETHNTIKHIYNHPLETILQIFDQNVGRVINPHCIGAGIESANLSEVLKDTKSD